MGNDFAVCQLMGMSKYNAVEQHQGKEYHETAGNGLLYFRTEKHLLIDMLS